jgi:hypothetical protein
MSSVASMLDDLELCRDDLSPWESDFVDSLAEQWEEREWLSERQTEILQKIWDEKT